MDSLITYNQYEKARLLANNFYLLLKNESRDNKNREFLLEIKLRQSDLLLRAEETTAALEVLLDIIDQAAKGRFYAIACSANLNMALAYEKTGHQNLANQYLDAAEILYRKHNLAELYSSILVRRSLAYLRTSPNQNLDSAKKYALLAKEGAGKYHREKDLSGANLILGVIHRELGKSEIPASTEYFIQALKSEKKVRNFNGVIGKYLHIARNYGLIGETEKAGLYIDSAYLNYHYATDESKYQLAAHKGALFRQSGNIDSAYYYLQSELEGYIRLQEKQEAVISKRLEEQYQNDKKEAIINSRNQLLILMGFVVLVVTGSAWLLFRQNRRIRSQKALIDRQVITLEEVLQHKQKLDETKSLFYANASHELRTPLTLILEPLNTLFQNESLGETQKQLLAIARQGGPPSATWWTRSLTSESWMAETWACT